MPRRAKAKTSSRKTAAGGKTARRSSAAASKTPKSRKGKAAVKKTAATRAAKSAKGKTAKSPGAAAAKKSKKTVRTAAAPKAPGGTAKTGRKKVAAEKRPTTKRSTVTGGGSATSQDPIQFNETRAKMPKTFLSAKELREFKQVLLQKRAELAGDVMHLSDEVSNRKGPGGGDHSSMPIHMADLGTDNWEQEFTLGLIANEQGRIREIDEALTRILSRTYGMCLATRKPINRRRLLAKPWAKYCIDYARAREEGRAR